MKTTNKKLFYFIAGEASGDLHGAHLIKQFKKQTNNQFVFRGLGGPKMVKEGFRSIENFDRLSVMGFYEVLKDLFFFIKLKRKIIKDIIKNKPNKIILIDYPGFNLKIAESIKKYTNTKIYYYISPQLWAWKEKRIHIIKKYVDEMIVLFPFEVKWYQKRGLCVQYFGHPLVDVYSKSTKKYSPSNLTIGLFPGSRKQEIKKHIPLMQSVINKLEDYFINRKINIVVGVVDNKEYYDDNPMFFSEKGTINYVVDSFESFEMADVAIVASGTATLECAITQTPMVVVYKMSKISWWISKYFIKIPFASIVNILAKNSKGIVKEFLQTNCTSSAVALETKKLLQLSISEYMSFHLHSPHLFDHIDEIQLPRTKQIQAMKKVINQLGNGTAYYQTVDFILKS